MGGIGVPPDSGGIGVPPDIAVIGLPPDLASSARPKSKMLGPVTVEPSAVPDPTARGKSTVS